MKKLLTCLLILALLIPCLSMTVFAEEEPVTLQVFANIGVDRTGPMQDWLAEYYL